MTVAEVGNIVEFMDGLRGRVEKINDNSVIVDLTNKLLTIKNNKM
ncbi:hypothetical protein Q518_00632 [Staphylococcus aureus M1350]|nr:hypothetical protein Q518_00632 [Staphylococcus aureus M1350]